MYKAIIIALLLLTSACNLFLSNEEKGEKYYKKGLKSIEEKNTQDALIHFKNAVQKNPYHAKARYQLGLLYIQSDQLYMAVRELNLALMQNPDLNEARKTLAILSYQNQAYAQAIPLCKKLIENIGNDLEILIIWGNSLLNTKNNKEARQVLDRAVKAFPENAPAKIQLAHALILDNQFDSARELMETAAKKALKDISVQTSLALFYEEIKLNELSEKKFIEIYTSFPDNPDSYLSFADFYIRQKRISEAENIVKKAINLKIYEPKFFYTLAKIQNTKGDYESAIQSLKEGVKIAKDKDEEISRLLLADYFIFLKRFSEARAVYEEMINKWPKLSPVKTKIAEILLAEKRYDIAQKQIDEILAENGNNARGNLLKGLLYMKDGKIADARKYFSKSRDLNPDSPDGHYYFGLTFLDEGDYKISMSEVLKAIEKDPDSMQAQLALAYIYYKTGKASSALDTLKIILNEQPSNYKARALRGIVYQELKNYNEAILDYKYIIENSKDAYDISINRFRLADIYLFYGNIDYAQKEFELTLDNYPDPVKPIEKIASIYEIRGEFDKAIKLCDDYLAKNPDNLQIHLFKINIFIRQKDYNKAETILLKLIEKNPKSDQIVILAAKLYNFQKDYSKTVSMFKKAIEINPQNIEAYMELSATFKELKQPDKAAETYEALLKINPSFVPAINDLAYLYADLNTNIDRAQELAIKAKQMMPDSPEVADTLGLVYFKKGSYFMAKKYISEALDKKPNDPFFLYHMGTLEYKENNIRKALEFFNKSVKAGIDKNELINAKQLIQEIESIIEKMEIAKKYYDSGEPKKAIQLYEELVKFNGFYEGAASELSSVYADLGENLDMALDLATKSLKARPENPYLLDTLGLIYLKKGTILMAQKYFNEAIRIKPAFSTFHYHLGVLLHKQKNFTQAKEELQKAIQLGLNQKHLEDAKKLLDEGFK
ncbi:MAG: tetratricopeptide repeat protein [Desulfobacterales bacterium]|nr:tetratricopeptide repeat protein [Desulfobacterales bacterium]MBF0397752.1 tetratricopeptide repeat protein [Desulfobacterales bacterium]